MEISNFDINKYPILGLFTPEQAKDYFVVSEEDMIHSYNEYKDQGKANPFLSMLERAGFMKRHGLTPVFLSSMDRTKMLVTSTENIEKKLN